MRSSLGAPMAKRTMSWVWEASRAVEESMTDPMRESDLSAKGIVVGAFIVLLDNQRAGAVRQHLRPARADAHRFGHLEGVPAQPHPGDHVKGHVLGEDRLVFRPQAHGALP